MTPKVPDCMKDIPFKMHAVPAADFDHAQWREEWLRAFNCADAEDKFLQMIYAGPLYSPLAQKETGSAMLFVFQPVKDLGMEVERLTAERDQARATMAATIGALQDLSIAPEDVGIAFYVLNAAGGKVVIEPRCVEGVFAAMEQHAAKLLPWGKAAIDSHYAIDGLRRALAELRAENEQLKNWKESQLAVEATWDEQAVGRALNVGLGQSIRDKILPAIQNMKTEIKRLTDGQNPFAFPIDHPPEEE